MKLDELLPTHEVHSLQNMDSSHGGVTGGSKFPLDTVQIQQRLATLDDQL